MAKRKGPRRQSDAELAKSITALEQEIAKTQPILDRQWQDWYDTKEEQGRRRRRLKALEGEQTKRMRDNEVRGLSDADLKANIETNPNYWSRFHARREQMRREDEQVAEEPIKQRFRQMATDEIASLALGPMSRVEAKIAHAELKRRKISGAILGNLSERMRGNKSRYPACYFENGELKEPRRPPDPSAMRDITPSRKRLRTT